MDNIKELLKARRNIVGEIFVKAGINDATEDNLLTVVGIAQRVRHKGYSLEMVAENLVNEKNVEIIREVGLDLFLKSAVKVKYPSIQAKRMKFDRNAPCFCGSGKKHKRCCINKTQ